MYVHIIILIINIFVFEKFTIIDCILYILLLHCNVGKDRIEGTTMLYNKKK